jgi:hypothetical protein
MTKQGKYDFLRDHQRWNIGFNILKKPVFQHSITSEIPKMEGHQKVNSCGQGRGR